ncbi:MAG: hypothetical protein J3K34DRAFT_522954 [Monoraphidium minutum]|nr:MAG: hypothetical protein J3K34DRAFT_522954 [Monoraphidium minutum]
MEQPAKNAPDHHVLEGTVESVRTNFGFIKTQSLVPKVFFHASCLVAPCSEAARACAADAARASPALPPAHAAPPMPAPGARVAFQLAPDSTRTKPVAARVCVLPGDAPPRDGAGAGGALRVGIVSAAAWPPAAGNAAWAARLHNGLIRFIDADTGGEGGGGTMGSEVTFRLMADPAAAQRAAAAPGLDARAAFWASHAAAQVAPLPAGAAAALGPEERRQLAILRLLEAAADVLPAAAAAQRKGG